MCTTETSGFWTRVHRPDAKRTEVLALSRSLKHIICTNILALLPALLHCVQETYSLSRKGCETKTLQVCRVYALAKMDTTVKYSGSVVIVLLIWLLSYACRWCDRMRCSLGIVD